MFDSTRVVGVGVNWEEPRVGSTTTTPTPIIITNYLFTEYIVTTVYTCTTVSGYDDT